MTEIVERLRKKKALLRHEAADRIEALEAELREARMAYLRLSETILTNIAERDK